MVEGKGKAAEADAIKQAKAMAKNEKIMEVRLTKIVTSPGKAPKNTVLGEFKGERRILNAKTIASNLSCFKPSSKILNLE